MKLSLCAILLAGGLAAYAAPAGAAVDDEHGEKRADRTYDNGNHNGHKWNSQEERNYRQYLKDRNRSYRPWKQASRSEQEEYWRWRDSHMNNGYRNGGNRHDQDDRDRADRDRNNGDRDRNNADRNRDRDDQDRR